MSGRLARRIVWVGAGMAALAWSLGAAADTPPSVWDRARDATVGASWKLHVEVSSLMSQESEPIPFSDSKDVTLEKALALLDAADAAHSKDVRLRFDLGIVLEHLNRHERAVAVLEPALAMAPDHPAADTAWLQLAFAYAKLNRPADEKRGYIAYLERSTSPEGRAVALLNYAETEMRLGRLQESIASYRDAMRHSALLQQEVKTYVLARWGLAVALDRYGDVNAANREAEEAAKLDRSEMIIGDQVGVFFVPAYERSWYLALSAAAHARLAADNPLAALAYSQRAEVLFSDYVARATPSDPWKAIAERRLITAKAERTRLAAKVRTLPRQRLTPQDLE